MPLLDPIPVAVKVTPTVFEEAPIEVKFVLPTDTIVYCLPITKLPAVSGVKVLEVTDATVPLKSTTLEGAY